MPVLAQLLVSAFSGLVAWLLQYVTRKVAFGIAAGVTFTAITVALFTAMRVALSGIESATSGAPALFIQAVANAVPPVAPLCLSTYVTIWVACTVYRWQRDLLFVALNS